MPEVARLGGASCVARPESGIGLPLSVPRPRPGPWLSGASSMTVFQAPQASQRPAHLRWLAPQAVQVKAVPPVSV